MSLSSSFQTSKLAVLKTFKVPYTRADKNVNDAHSLKVFGPYAFLEICIGHSADYIALMLCV